MFERKKISLHSKGRPVTMHLISTGMVAVKTRFRNAANFGWMGTIDFVTDRRFTELMPIWVMVLEHPEGIFLIDTGEISDVTRPDYFRSSGFFTSWFDRSQFRFTVEKEEEIDQQLQSLHIQKEKLKAIILTHLHFDHTDGLKFFPGTPVLVNKEEWEKPFGDLPKLYPPGFSPTLVSLDQSFDVFEKSKFLTEAEDLLLVHTPGHTWGHCSVLFRADEGNILFAADTCYSAQQLLNDQYAAISASHVLVKQTYATVRSFASRNKTVFLPSHDPDAGKNLVQLSFLNPGTR